jgi:hypothetical protein
MQYHFIAVTSVTTISCSVNKGKSNHSITVQRRSLISVYQRAPLPEQRCIHTWDRGTASRQSVAGNEPSVSWGGQIALNRLGIGKAAHPGK